MPHLGFISSKSIYRLIVANDVQLSMLKAPSVLGVIPVFRVPDLTQLPNFEFASNG